MLSHHGVFAGRYASERENLESVGLLARGIWWAWRETPAVLLGVRGTTGEPIASTMFFARSLKDC